MFHLLHRAEESRIVIYLECIKNTIWSQAAKRDIYKSLYSVPGSALNG